MGQGDAVVHIYINNLAQVQIELPPIEEQNAIAEVLSDMDGLINALHALITKKHAHQASHHAATAHRQGALIEIRCLVGEICNPDTQSYQRYKWRFKDLEYK